MKTVHVSRSDPWFPPSLLNSPGPVRYTFRLSDAELKIWRTQEAIPVSKWAEKYRVVTMSILPGKWHNEVTPYLAGIMDASFFESVRTIILCSAPQVGKTEAVLNCLAYAIDREPGPALCIYPDELTGRENNRDRIEPMIRQSPRLRGYMTAQQDDSTMLRISLQHMPIYIAWARSASRLANKPIRYVIFDETDKYPETAGRRETDPISLGESRTITYRHNCRKWKMSTPTIESAPIWKALTTEAQVIFDYWVACPFCGALQVMAFSQIKWKHKAEPGPDGKCHSEDPETIEAEKLAWYECPHCLAAWNDYDRDLAVRRGRWRSRPKKDTPGTETDLKDYLNRHHPVKIGFHLPSWVSPFVSLSSPAAAFLRGRTDMNKFKDFYNKHRAEPWKLTVISRDKEHVLAARCDLPPQTVPPEAIVLTCGVDVQQFGFWFAVRAWAPYMTSWLIHYGFLSTWEEVAQLIFERSFPVDGDPDRSMRIFRACVDTGGSKKFEDMTMTEETYFWLIANRGRGGVALWGTKGSSTTLPGMLSLGSGIVSTPSGKKLPEALRLISVDSQKAKDQFHYRLNTAVKEETRDLPGAGFLHSGVGDDYVAQLLAEEKQLDEKGHEVWVNVHQRPNHLFDAEVLAAACVEMEFPGGGLRLIAEYLKEQEKMAAIQGQTESMRVVKSNWMNR